MVTRILLFAWISMVVGASGVGFVMSSMMLFSSCELSSNIFTCLLMITFIFRTYLLMFSLNVPCKADLSYVSVLLRSTLFVLSCSRWLGNIVGIDSGNSKGLGNFFPMQLDSKCSEQTRRCVEFPDTWANSRHFLPLYTSNGIVST